MLWAVHLYAKREIHDPPIWLSVLLGVGIGFLSGLTGTGGGIFLSPVIIFLSLVRPANDVRYCGSIHFR